MKLTCSIIKSVLALLLFFAFLSCSKDEVEKTKEKSLFLECDKGMTNDIDTVRTHIIGKYDWVYTHIETRSDSYYTTPERENLTLSYVFMENSEVEEYRNGVLIDTYTYEINTVTVYGGEEPTEEGSVIRFYEKSKEKKLKEVFYESICNDSARFFVPDSHTINMQFTRNSL